MYVYIYNIYMYAPDRFLVHARGDIREGARILIVDARAGRGALHREHHAVVAAVLMQRHGRHLQTFNTLSDV